MISRYIFANTFFAIAHPFHRIRMSIDPLTFSLFRRVWRCDQARINRRITVAHPAGCAAQRSAQRSDARGAARRGGAAIISFFLTRVDPPPHHSADLYISWRVSHFRHYHSCRGSARAHHTRLAVPSCRVHADRKWSRRGVRAFSRASTLSRALPLSFSDMRFFFSHCALS